MRIAISGSHSLGKSTVVRDWLNSNPDYLWEDEPYRALSLNGPYEIAFQDKSTRLHNGLQLFYSISRVHRYSSITDGIRPLDVEYRDSVDLIFKKIYRENLYNLSPVFRNLKLIELIGDQTQRLHQIQAAIESFSS